MRNRPPTPIGLNANTVSSTPAADVIASMRASSASSGCRPEAIGLRRVHRGRPEIADLLLVAAGRRLLRRRRLADAAQARIQLVVDLVADAPRRLGRRDRMRLQPPAVGVLEEVHARIDRRVHVRGEEILRAVPGVGGEGGTGGERQRGRQQRDAEGSREAGHLALRGKDSRHCPGGARRRQGLEVMDRTHHGRGFEPPIVQAGMDRLKRATGRPCFQRRGGVMHA